MNVLSNKVADTIKLGENIAKSCKAGDIICLSGELGTGKTTLVKGIAKGLKINPSDVHSPTFVLLSIYEGKLPLFHFDLYRIENEKELEAIGYEEFVYGQGIAVIEWAEKMGALLPKNYLGIELQHKKNGGREINIKALGKKYERFRSNL